MKDPVRGCDVYKNIGCAHVDGFLCDYPNCSILKDYKMKERIKELWDTAAKLESDPSWEGQTKFMEKFAELIVRECLQVINQPNGVGDDDVIRISDDVKQHFGVDGMSTEDKKTLIKQLLGVKSD
jgi:hypothetical protein